MERRKERWREGGEEKIRKGEEKRRENFSPIRASFFFPTFSYAFSLLVSALT